VLTGRDELERGLHLDAARRSMHHPAILFWVLGNEWNHNHLYGYPSTAEAAGAINQAAGELKALDSYHPVASSLGDGFTPGTGDDIPAAVAATPQVDLWGLNMYRGDSFGSLFDQWKQVSSKPFFLSEFGVDSFQTTAYTRPFPADDAEGRGGIAKV